MTKTISDVEKEINKIRIELYNETKNLSVEERVKRTNKLGKELAKKYDFKIVSKV
ncbi:MAG: hypothetical protein FWF46_08155 [Oscillospiraceae bacterium]|nr:hypothetical protein [Oscillospiraceae bacterium]